MARPRDTVAAAVDRDPHRPPAVVAPLVPVTETLGAKDQKVGRKSQVSRCSDGYVFIVIAVINATDATPSVNLLRAWCRSLPLE
jgi:hypothetical protein